MGFIARDQMFAILFFLLGLSSGAWSQSNEVLDIEAKNTNGLLEVTVTFTQKPDLQLYQSGGMERIEAEFMDTGGGLFALRGAATGSVRKEVPSGVETWSIEKSSLSDVTLYLELNHRPEPGTLKGEVLEKPWRAVISCQTQYRFEQEFPISDSVFWKQTEIGSSDGYELYNELSLEPKGPDLRLEMLELSSPQTVIHLVKESGAVCGINGASGAQDSVVFSQLSLPGTVLSEIPEREQGFYVLDMGFDRFLYVVQGVLYRVDEEGNRIVWQLETEEENITGGEERESIRYPRSPKDDPRDERLAPREH